MNEEVNFQLAGKNLVAFAKLESPQVFIPTMVAVQSWDRKIDIRRTALKTMAEFLTTNTLLGLTFAMRQSQWKGIDRKDFLHYLTFHEIGWFWNLWQWKNIHDTKYDDFMKNRFAFFRTSGYCVSSDHSTKLALGIYYELFKEQADNEHLGAVKNILEGKQSIEQCYPGIEVTQLFWELSSAAHC